MQGQQEPRRPHIGASENGTPIRITKTKTLHGITSTTNTRTTADSDFRPLGIRRHSTPGLESLIAQPGHPQQTTIAPATKPAPGRATSNRPSSKAGFRRIKHTATPGARHRRSNFIAAATPIYSISTPLGQHQPCTLSAHHYAHGTPWGIFSLTDSYLPHAMGCAIDMPKAERTTSRGALRNSQTSFRVHPGFKFRSIGSIPVIRVYPGLIRVYTGPIRVYPGLIPVYSGLIRVYPGPFLSIPVSFGSIPVSFGSILVSFGSIPVPVIRVHPDHSCHPGHSGPSRSFRSIPVSFGSILVHSGLSRSIRVYPGPFGSIPVSFRSILVHSGPSRF
ncbi:hypothetical protein CRG98_021457 [Punica granatum]|uniref:Uncharacterized protein n=1 Tax=Punica granatum TaxID=22663 RepID=A0A2I0JPB8_PUNGR|nr:hypothetical protein CRG98_021457 [Punica granatum]